MTDLPLETEALVASAIQRIWILCRYSRGAYYEKGTIGPLMLMVRVEGDKVSWEPTEIDFKMSSKAVFAVAAGILNADKDTHAILFMFDSIYGDEILFKSWMMMVFSRTGIGPVAVSSLSSCYTLYTDGPEITGKLSEEKNAERVEEYLETVDEEISMDIDYLPEYGFAVTTDDFSLDSETSPDYFLSLLRVSSKEWN